MDKEDILDFIGCYAGGQLSITRGDFDKGTREHYCGTIEKIVIENDSLKVKLAWNAKIVPLKTNPQKERWVKYDELDYVFDLNDCEFSQNIDFDRNQYFPFDESFYFESNTTRERVYLKSPKVKRRLDPNSVKGL